MTWKIIVINPCNDENGYLMYSYGAIELQNEGKMMEMKVKVGDILETQQLLWGTTITTLGIHGNNNNNKGLH